MFYISRILSPLLMDEFGWTNFQTVFYGGIILAGAGVVAIFCFHFVKWLSARYVLTILHFLNSLFENCKISNVIAKWK